ncbi:MAG: pyridoxal-phosphate dependent enzyme [Candidatus Lokiarchaeota archaeon]|nr:pyridoxal-phosphate dependent enzyme [Candidatus Lokiarchaeota archaeon]
MKQEEPILFQKYPNLRNRVPWIPLLTNVPTPIERLTELEKEFKLDGGEIYIKRDDKNHPIYGGNKLRKFEFIFGKVLKKKKKGVVTNGGIGTNHGLACAIICHELNPPLKCHLYLFHQQLTWHVQRLLLLFDYFGVKLHLGKGMIGTFVKFLFFKLLHPKYFLMFPGGSPLFGIGTSLGTIGFVNAAFELKNQIDQTIIREPDIIFVAGGTVGTAAGLVAGCKLLGLKLKVHIVAVSTSLTSNPSAVKRNANKAIKYLRKKDKSIPNIKINEEDFVFITGYLGSGYGIKTLRGQNAVDKVFELEGCKRDFKLETTYTGKAMAAMFDYLKQEENKNKTILFWNTYNSNDLDKYLKETNFQYKKLPRKFHKFYEESKFQCWQITNCPEDIKKSCPAYLNHEYRFWKITDCLLDEQKQRKALEVLKSVIKLEDA